MFVTLRPAPQTGPICVVCHAQMIGALETRKMDPANTGQGYWKVRIWTSMCTECQSHLPFGRALLSSFYRRQAALKITSVEMSELFVSSTTAHFVQAPERAGGSNLALSSQRRVTQQDILADGLLAQAQLELIPAVIAQLAARTPGCLRAFTLPLGGMAGLEAYLFRLIWLLLRKSVFSRRNIFLRFFLPTQLLLIPLWVIALRRRGACYPEREWVVERKNTDAEPRDPADPGDTEPISSVPAPVESNETSGVTGGMEFVQGSDHILAALSGSAAAHSIPSVEATTQGVRIAPTLDNRVLYTNNESNVDAAVAGRITGAQQSSKFGLSAEQRKELRLLPEAMCKGPHAPFSRKAVLDCIQTLLGMDMVSKKWTEKRAINAVHQLEERYAPEFKLKTMIKNEPMKGAKAPRLIISDGDAGQLMALISIGVLERLLFKSFKEDSIKEVDKPKAMEQLSKKLRKRPGDKSYSILENDGTAWDAHCGPELRDDTENILIEWVDDCLQSVFVPEHKWSEAHLTTNKKAKLRLAFCVRSNPYTLQDLFATMRKKKYKMIDAIRRSGHRGTSVLNWVVNYACWSWVIFGKNAAGFADSHKRHGTTYDGKRVSVDKAFEGDDSILGVVGLTEEMVAEYDNRWRLLGHEPKLYLRKPRDEPAEFTGYLFGVDENGLTDMYAPDVKRHMSNGPVSVSKDLVNALKDNKCQVARTLASMSLTSIGIQYEKLPSIGQYYLRLASEYDPNITKNMTQDLMRKMDLGKIEFCVERWKANQNEWLMKQSAKEPGLETFVNKVIAPNNETVQAEADVAIAMRVVKDREAYRSLIACLQATTTQTDLDQFRQGVKAHLL